jgi:aminoglycoside phosphotransferase (APT) family kinase protein
LGELQDLLTEYYLSQNLEWSKFNIIDINEITFGWETELYTFKLNYTSEGTSFQDERVIRIFSGHNASKKAAKEYSIMKRLKNAQYPVPEVYNLETSGTVLGKPFLIMERIKGEMVIDKITGGKMDYQTGLNMIIELFVNLHNIDFSNVFPENKIKNTHEYIEEHITWYKNRIKEKGLHWIQPIIEWIDERKNNVTPVKLSILHRDFHWMNILMWEDGTISVIDWGASTVGDFRDDLAWTMLLYGTFGELNEMRTIQEAYEKTSGKKIKDIDFFLVLAALRRVVDVLLSITESTQSLGMKTETLEMMRKEKDHFRKVQTVLENKTCIKLKKLSEVIESF